MRGWDERSEVLFSYVNCEARVPKDHPLRAILRIVDAALAALSPEFEGLYAKFGRPSIPPERLLRALLLQAFYSVRSETQLMEQLQYNLLFRWFVGLSLDEAVWDETVFTKNRERLIEGDIARRFMAAVLNQEPVKALLSDDHFSVDGTLIEAWASMKSFRPKDGGGEPPAPGRNGERDFHGEKRSNETHASTPDPDARLYRKGPGQPAKLAYLGHVLMENRHALVIDTGLTLATGTAERAAALEMVAARPGNHRITLGADKAYDVAGFVADLRQHNVTPHVARPAKPTPTACPPKGPGYWVDASVETTGSTGPKRLDVVRTHQLRGDVVNVKRPPRRAHMERHDVLPGREPSQIRDHNLDDEAAAGFQVGRDIAEAGQLRRLRRQNS